jgi:hypothetical protein
VACHEQKELSREKEMLEITLPFFRPKKMDLFSMS